ncbi:MAG TPA: SIS domain-containing protein, partial [Candidatus Omnitrophota bacterium]|nr:SIS domain-containing protein [Candidatus Omnitrophota bacterium]
MDQRIKSIVLESIRVKEEAFRQNMEKIQSAVEMITDCFKNGRKLLICGNGGSAADSQHIAAEFVGRFQKERKALAAVSLTTDTSILTCLSNDYQFDCVFSRQVEA